MSINTPALNRAPLSNGHEAPPLNNTVLIFHHLDDESVAQELKTDLTEEGFNCLTSEDIRPGESTLDGFERLQSESQRFICIISKQLLQDEELQFQLEQLQIEGKERKKPMIAVLHNIEPSMVPFYIKEINYTQTTDEYFKDKILNGLKTESMPPSAMIPTTDIAEGLAWAYWYNYLCFVLPGLKDRMKKRFDGTGVHYSTKFVLLMPTSCQARNLTKIDKNISLLDTLKFTMTVGAASNRDYSNNVVKITHPETKQVMMAVVEFATPLQTLHQMELGVRAGLSAEEKGKQMEEFIKKMNEIIDFESGRTVDDVLVALKYDDRSEQAKRDPHHLSKLIMGRIQN